MVDSHRPHEPTETATRRGIDWQASTTLSAPPTAPTPIAAPIAPTKDLAIPSLLDTPVPTARVQAAPAAAVAPVQTFLIADEEQETPLAGVSRHPARLVGGVRLPGVHRAGKGAQGPRATVRAARRAVGARLCAAVQHEEVAAPSFDASRLRLQIQVGLRMSSRVCSDKAREVVTPAAHEGGSAAAKILNIITFLAMQYIELREHQSISDDIVCPSPHRLRCGSPLPCR